MKKKTDKSALMNIRFKISRKKKLMKLAFDKTMQGEGKVTVTDLISEAIFKTHGI